MSGPGIGARRAFLGVALVSLGVLALQLALTRLFSATMYYHFAFLAVSLALLGSGAGGIAVYAAARRLDPADTARHLALGAALFGLTTAGALVVVLANPLSPLDAGTTTLLRVARIYAAASLPFFCAGGVISLAVTRFADQMPRLYAFDLAGAAAGCVLLVPAMDVLGAVDTVLAVAVVGAAAGAVFAGGAGRAVQLAAAAPAVALLLVAADNAAHGRLAVTSAKGLVEAGHVIFSKWNSFSRVTVWGDLANDSVLVMIDADAATVLYRAGDRLERHRHLEDRIEALAYHLRPGAPTLIIGAGAGPDVITARLFGSRDVTAVEVNPVIAEDVMGREPFRSYSGDLYGQPGVRLVVDEARSFLRSSERRYGVIQGTMVDTWAATAAGAFALTENNLYTVEAFEDFAARLDDDGILSFTRWYTDPPDQLLRLTAIGRAMMDARGVADPARHVLLFHAAPDQTGARAPATFLFKKSPFSDDEVRRAESAAARLGFVPLYTPLTRPPNSFTRLVEAHDPAAVWRGFERDVAPTRDDSPFFFNSARFAELAAALRAPEEWRKTNLGTFVLAGLLLATVVATALFILVPLAALRGGALHRPSALASVLFFACLGAGYMALEIVLIQKSILFLGHPVYALAVVLFSLLAWNAAGSYLSGRLLRDERLEAGLSWTLGVLAALVLLYVAALSPIFYALVHLARPYRIAAAVALLAPLGLAMGMPMPAGVRLVARRAPQAVPWGWGVNGAASVLGSAAALVTAVHAGFDAALLGGAGIYVLAAVCMRRAGRG